MMPKIAIKDDDVPLGWKPAPPPRSPRNFPWRWVLVLIALAAVGASIWTYRRPITTQLTALVQVPRVSGRWTGLRRREPVTLASSNSATLPPTQGVSAKPTIAAPAPVPPAPTVVTAPKPAPQPPTSAPAPTPAVTVKPPLVSPSASPVIVLAASDSLDQNLASLSAAQADLKDAEQRISILRASVARDIDEKEKQIQVARAVLAKESRGLQATRRLLAPPRRAAVSAPRAAPRPPTVPINQKEIKTARITVGHVLTDDEAKLFKSESR